MPSTEVDYIILAVIVLFHVADGMFLANIMQSTRAEAVSAPILCYSRPTIAHPSIEMGSMRMEIT